MAACEKQGGGGGGYTPAMHFIYYYLREGILYYWTFGGRKSPTSLAKSFRASRGCRGGAVVGGRREAYPLDRSRDARLACGGMVHRGVCEKIRRGEYLRILGRIV